MTFLIFFGRTQHALERYASPAPSSPSSASSASGSGSRRPASGARSGTSSPLTMVPIAPRVRAGGFGGGGGGGYSYGFGDGDGDGDGDGYGYGDGDGGDGGYQGVGGQAKKAKTKMHRCTVCEKVFPRPSGLATHMNSHSGAKRELFEFLEFFGFCGGFRLRAGRGQRLFICLNLAV